METIEWDVNSLRQLRSPSIWGTESTLSKLRYSESTSHLRSHFLHLLFIAGQKHPLQSGGVVYFRFAFFHFAQRVRCAAAIFLRADADKVRFRPAEPVVFAAAVAGCDRFRTFIHLAFCASAIFRRELADMIRVGGFVARDSPEPFNDSITENAWSNFSK